MDILNSDFMALYSQRNEEDAAIETGATKAARTAHRTNVAKRNAKEEEEENRRPTVQ